MNQEQIGLLKKVWQNNIIGKEYNFDTLDLKDFLYKSLISRNDEIIDRIKLVIPKSEGLDFLQELVNNFSNVELNPLGFFPVGILKTGKLTCAGNAMLANTVLNAKGYEVKYARPVFHSVNFVKFESEYYWVDTTNGIFEKIDVSIEEMNTFSVAYLRTNNEKIRYTVIPFFKPQDMIINIFGNMEALKSRNYNDSMVREYLKENQDIYRINFNDIFNSMYEEYLDFLKYNSKFNLEQQRFQK